MAVVKAQRVLMAVHAGAAPGLLGALQSNGLIEPIPVEAWPVQDDVLSVTRPFGDRLFDLESESAALRRCLAFLGTHAPEPGALKSLFSPKPGFSLQGLANQFQGLPLDQVYGQVREAEARLQEISAEETRSQQLAEALEPWRDVDIRLSELEGLKSAEVLMVTGLVGSQTTLRRALGEVAERAHIDSLSEDKNTERFLVVCLKEDQEAADEAIRDSALTVVEKPVVSQKSEEDTGSGIAWAGTPAEILAGLRDRSEALEAERLKVVDIARQLSAHREALRAASDYVELLKARKEAEGWLVRAGDVALAMGWVLENKKEELRKSLSKAVSHPHVEFFENNPDDEPPIQLENTPATRPFSVLTGLYGLPKHSEADPTPLLTPFFFVFFGLCLTDSGYGLLLALLFGWGLRKMTLSPTAKNFFRLLFLGGISALIFGGFVGGWLGNTPKLLPESLGFLDRWANSILVLDPIKNPVPFLILSLILGVLQIYVGLVAKFVATHAREGAREAVLNEGVEIFLLSGFLFLGLSGADLLPEFLVPIANWMASIAVVTTILARGREYKNIFAKLGGGLLGVYGLVNYLGDILSYSRLFALGLATGVIAVVVNTLTALLGQVPYVGVLLIPVVYVVGHAFNLVISSLGAFIHSARLQYVEFFSKFYEGGGRAMAPFRSTPRYVDLET